MLTGCQSEKLISVPADQEESSQENADTGDQTEDISAGRESVLVVFVCGAVKSEGVYELPAGARLNDAIHAAGGFSDEAATDALNLAGFAEDGQKLYVPTKEEFQGQQAEQDGSGTEDGQSPEPTGKLDINTAGKEALMTLSGIGEAKASGIIAYREEHGAFEKIEDIMNVSGIGENLFQKIKDDICVNK